MPLRVRLYIALIALLGLGVIVLAVADRGAVTDPMRMAVFTVLTALASLVKLRLPGLEGTYSLNAVFLLAGAVYFTLPEAVLAAAAAAMVQTFAVADRRPRAVQAIFNLSNEILSVALAQIALAALVRGGVLPFRPALLAAAAAVYFALNTGLVSGVLSLLGGGQFRQVNSQWYLWSFPYYLVGAAVLGVLPIQGNRVDFEACALLVPLAYLAHFFCGIAQRKDGPPADAQSAAGEIPGSAKIFTAMVVAVALAAAAFSLSRFEPLEWPLFLSLLALGIMTATWKVGLPGTTGTISVHYVVVLVAIAELSMVEALAISAVGPLVQTVWRAKVRPQPIQILFNLGAMTLSTGLVYVLCRLPGETWPNTSLALFLTAAALLHFLTNTFLVAEVISLVERTSVVSLWRRVYFWAFPIYMVGAATAAVMVATVRAAGWAPSLLILPLMAMVQYSYRLHVSGQLRLIRGIS